MNKFKNGFFQAGLIIFVASLFAGAIILKNVDLNSVLAGKNAVYKYHPWDDCKLGKLCRAPQDRKDRDDKNYKNCTEVYEGCLIEERCTNINTGKDEWFTKGRSKDCGAKDNEKTPKPTKTPHPTPTPTHTPRLTPTCTPTSTPHITPTPTATPSETPTPTGTPNSCNGTCGSNYNCQGGFFCNNGYCRSSSCPNDSTCGCVPSPTPTAPPVLGAKAPPVLPKTGANDLSILVGLLSTMSVGVVLFKKFKLI